jgi:hypothetical protein
MQYGVFFWPIKFRKEKKRKPQKKKTKNKHTFHHLAKLNINFLSIAREYYYYSPSLLPSSSYYSYRRVYFIIHLQYYQILPIFHFFFSSFPSFSLKILNFFNFTKWFFGLLRISSQFEPIYPPKLSTFYDFAITNIFHPHSMTFFFFFSRQFDYFLAIFLLKYYHKI